MTEKTSTTKKARPKAAPSAAETVAIIPLSELHPFKDHPFAVRDDEAMTETAESVMRYPTILEIRGLRIDVQAHICSLYGKEVILTPTEFSILLMLCQNKGSVISSERIFESIWGEKYYEGNNTVMVHMQNLRKKLGDTKKRKEYIQTVWGVGYKIEE